MTTYNTDIVKCPYCGTLHTMSIMASTYVYSESDEAEKYIDTMLSDSIYAERSDIGQCFNVMECGKLFWFKDALVESFSELVIMTKKDSRYYQSLEDKGPVDRWIDNKYAEISNFTEPCVGASWYLGAIDQGLGRTPDEEIFLRYKAWVFACEEAREAQQSCVDDEGMANVELLASLLSEDTLLKAELLRQMYEHERSILCLSNIETNGEDSRIKDLIQQLNIKMDNSFIKAGNR